MTTKGAKGFRKSRKGGRRAEGSGGGYCFLDNRVSKRRIENSFSSGRNVGGGGWGVGSVMVVAER